MIKRPLDPRFAEAVKSGAKFTTIRSKPWPVGVPIILYHWSGKPYRSKHVDVAEIRVLGYWPIRISQALGGEMAYAFGMKNEKQLHETEGFSSREEMDAWFSKLVEPSQTIYQTLMRFRVDAVPQVSQ